MKSNTAFLGIVISASIALIASLPKFFKSELIDWSFIVNTFLYTFLFAIVVWFILIATFKSFFIERKGKNKFWLIFGLLMFFGFLSFLFDRAFTFFAINPIQPMAESVNRRYLILLLRGFLISGLYIFILYYLLILEKKQTALIEITDLKHEQLLANISSLKEQLSPHFLFNTLNTLSALTNEKPVKDYIVELSNVYRYVLQYQNKDSVFLKQEIEFVESYLYIIKARFENAIEVSIDIDNKSLNSKLPPLTIQILVENVIKHNIAATYKPLFLKIYISQNQVIVIENNYQPKYSVLNSTGTGLDNISKRYQLLFNKEIQIEKKEDFFRVKLPLII